jgi:hypothetical protein
MDEPNISSSFQENDNKIEVTTSNNESPIPKFEDLVDIKNYNKKMIQKSSYKKDIA